MKTIISFSLYAVLCLTLFTACGTATAPPTASVDTAQVATTVRAKQTGTTINVAEAQALQTEADVLLIDVREQWEYDAGHIPNITHIPMNDIPKRLSELPKDKLLVITCQSGARSSRVTKYLAGQGYPTVYNMQGGFLAWSDAGYPVER